MWPAAESGTAWPGYGRGSYPGLGRVCLRRRSCGGQALLHGHVAAALGTARQLGRDELIDLVPSRSRDLVVAMSVAHCSRRRKGSWSDAAAPSEPTAS